MTSRTKYLGPMALLVAFAPAAVAADDSADRLDVDPAKPTRLVLHVLKTDGSPVRPLVLDADQRHRFDRQGTPEVSADGRLVAFDAWNETDPFDWEDSRIIVANMDGTEVRDLGDGVMPSFSPEAERLVVSRPPRYAAEDGAQGMSIWIIDVDGGNRTMIADRGAWGGRWSPDGRSIVFHGGVDEEGGEVAKNCLRLYDVQTGEVTNVFDPDESPFADLSYHFEWHKGDHRVVALGGRLKAGGAGSAVIEVDDGIDGLQMIKASPEQPPIAHGLSFDWHPDGGSVLMTGIVDGRPVPISVSTTDQASPHRFDELPDDVVVRDPIYTPNGSLIIASLGARPRDR